MDLNVFLHKCNIKESCRYNISTVTCTNNDHNVDDCVVGNVAI